MNKIITLVAIAIIVAGFLFWNKSHEHKACEERALAAAIETYPTNQYPNTSQRAQLQDAYKQQYIQSC